MAFCDDGSDVEREIPYSRFWLDRECEPQTADTHDDGATIPTSTNPTALSGAAPCSRPIRSKSRDWYRKKFSLAGRRVATGGSCFAQHLGREIRKQGHAYLDVEPAPGFLPADLHLDYGYGIYSARYGNIYTTRQWLQLIERAYGDRNPLDKAWPMRGWFRRSFSAQHRAGSGRQRGRRGGPAARPSRLECRHLFEQTDVFVFTLGMTETWMRIEDGTVFPIAPGARGGFWDETRNTAFSILTYGEILDDLEAVMARLRTIKPDMQFIFTVSPVAILATASREQVVVANSYSKSILRGVAGELDGAPFFRRLLPELRDDEFAADACASSIIPTCGPSRRPEFGTSLSHFVDQHAGTPQERVQVGRSTPVAGAPPSAPAIGSRPRPLRRGTGRRFRTVLMPDILLTGDSHTAALRKGQMAIEAEGRVARTGSASPFTRSAAVILTCEPFFIDRGDHAEITVAAYKRQMQRLPMGDDSPGTDLRRLGTAPFGTPLAPLLPGSSFAPAAMAGAASGTPVSSGMMQRLVLEDQKNVLDLLSLLKRLGKRVFVVEAPYPFHHHPAMRKTSRELVRFVDRPLP